MKPILSCCKLIRFSLSLCQDVSNYWHCSWIISPQSCKIMAMFARRRPLLPSFLSLVTVTKVLWYFNVMLFSFRYQAHIANQMVNIIHKWSRLDVKSDKSRLSKVFHRELSIILSHVSVTNNDRWVVIVKWSVPMPTYAQGSFFLDILSWSKPNNMLLF